MNLSQVPILDRIKKYRQLEREARTNAEIGGFVTGSYDTIAAHWAALAEQTQLSVKADKS
jgi:hypothetical protein